MQNKYIKPISIKLWAEEDRPREKLILHGGRALSDAELIAILIGSGSRNETAVELSKRILKNEENNLNNLARLTLNDLQQYRGIGEAKAISIMAALELGRRRTLNTAEKKPKISGSKEAYEVLKPLLADLNHEEFWILLLNTNNNVVGKALIGKGGSGVVAVDVKMIFQVALQGKATGIILSHNHPSGNLKPSISDKGLTSKITDAGKLLDIRVLDHLIISDEGYYSFSDEGDL